MKEEITQKEIAIIRGRISYLLEARKAIRDARAKVFEQDTPGAYRVTVFKFTVKDLLKDLGFNTPHQAQCYLNEVLNGNIGFKSQRYLELVKRLGI